MNDDLSYAAGAKAHAAGATIGDCPVGPADPFGHGWRLGWIQAEGSARYDAGTFGATDEEKAAARLTATPYIPPASRPVHTLAGSGRMRGHAPAMIVIDDPEALGVALRHLGAAFRESMQPLVAWFDQFAEAIAEAQLAAVSVDLPDSPPTPLAEVDRPGFRRKPFVCPVHGEQDHAWCRTCERSRHRRPRPGR